jgi:P63C domain
MDPIKRKAGKIGGAKRAEILPPDRRAEIARQAAAARWGVLPRATHKGTFKNEFGIDVECYVLDDPMKTAVISQTGMARALGLSAAAGGSLPRFLNGKAMIRQTGTEVRLKIENPIKFHTVTSGTEKEPRMIVYGYDAALLIDICKAITAIEATGNLWGRHKKVAAQAHIILGASAKAGIRQLVYALAGYSPSAEEVIAAFKLYVQEEARKYEPTFPNELYKEWHRLYDIPVLERGRSWHFKYLTVNHIYYPLAQSSGKILALLRANRAQGGNRAKRLFQFLNLIGARALGIHLGRVLEMAESSSDKSEYEAKLLKRFGVEQQLELPIPPPPPGKQLEAAN